MYACTKTLSLNMCTVATTTDSHFYKQLTDKILMRLVPEIYICDVQ